MSHQRGHALTGPRVPRLSAKNSKPLPIIVVACPDCGAGVGGACLSANGKPINRGHTARRRLAVRALLAERGVASS